MPDDLASFPTADDGRFRTMRTDVGELARGVVGRDDVLSAVQAAGAAGKGRTVLVVGDAGSGKSAALAAIASRDPAPTAVYFVGPELGQDDPRLVARSLAAEIGVSPVPEEHGAALGAFHAKLRAIAESGGRAVIVIDAIDRVRGAAHGAALELLPSAVPAGVLFVLSARPGAVADAIARHPGVGRLALAPLKLDARIAMARAIAPDRSDDALQAAANACDGHPLHLRAILLASDGGDALPPTVEHAFARFLTRLSRAVSFDVPRALGAIATSRSGLTRDDLAALLASPTAMVDGLLAAAKPWLRDRDGRIVIVDARLREWALAQMSPAQHTALHSAIADRLAAGAASKRADALLDLTMHLEAAGRAGEIADLVDSGRFARIKATASKSESVRDDLVRAARASDGDLVRALRFGLAAALLSADGTSARVVRAKTLAAAARGLPKKDGWELAERAAHEAFTESDPKRRDEFVVAAVTALRSIDAAEARRVASGQPRGAARVRALVAAGDMASALAEADDAPEAEREEALADVLEPMAATDPQEVTKLLPRLHDAQRRDGVLVALVAATKGIFLAGKISDASRRVTALAQVGEWDEAELAAEDVADGALRAAAHERIAAAARAAKEEARATAHEAHAKKARDAIASPIDRALALREGAIIALDANPQRARMLADEALDLDVSHASTRATLVLRARAAIAQPSAADLHDAIVALAPHGDALTDLYADVVGALAASLGARYPEAARAAVDGVDWAERFVATLGATGGVGAQTVAPPPLAPAIARAVSTLPWTITIAPNPEIASIEQRVRDDAATPEEVDRLVDARLSTGDRTGAVGALLGWASRLRARGDRIDAAAAEERARAIDPGDPRHPPESMRPPPVREAAPNDVEQIDGGWGDEDEPRTVREDVPRGEAPWSKAQSPMAVSIGSAPTVSARTATMMGVAAPLPQELLETPPVPTAIPPRKILDRTLRSEGLPIEPARIVTIAPPPEPTPEPPPPPEPEPYQDEIEAEDAADQTSIMGAAERKALQKATRTGDAAVLKEAAEKIAADRDAEERALARATEGHETARKLEVAKAVDADPATFDRPTVPPPHDADARLTPAIPFTAPASAALRTPAPMAAPSSQPDTTPPAAPNATPARAPVAAPTKKSSPGLAIAIGVFVLVILAVVAELYFVRH